jgi:hypothetical protein
MNRLHSKLFVNGDDDDEADDDEAEDDAENDGEVDDDDAEMKLKLGSSCKVITGLNSRTTGDCGVTKFEEPSAYFSTYCSISVLSSS